MCVKAREVPLVQRVLCVLTSMELGHGEVHCHGKVYSKV